MRKAFSCTVSQWSFSIITTNTSWLYFYRTIALAV